MPLKNLFRSHILQIAEYLGIPKNITARTPNPDLIPGVNDKYMDILGIPSDKVDLILYGLENKIKASQIAEQTGVQVSEVEKWTEKWNLCFRISFGRAGL